jgi:ATP-dependent Lon protease
LITEKISGADRVHDNHRSFKQTGQLGDVMRESAEITYSYVSSNLDLLQADKAYFDKAAVHLHVPEGATPKDGASAGVTMATALLSLAKNRRVQRDIALTGELTLSGRVLPVGGVKGKIIAARRAGIKELILPMDNQRDFDEMPDDLKQGLKMHFAESYALAESDRKANQQHSHFNGVFRKYTDETPSAFRRASGQSLAS